MTEDEQQQICKNNTVCLPPFHCRKFEHNQYVGIQPALINKQTCLDFSDIIYYFRVIS